MSLPQTMGYAREKKTRILLLGGTTEARKLAEILVMDSRFDVVLSLAGRTIQPDLLEGLPLRVGGFGGVRGLVEYIRKDSIEIVVDATHPFATQMSSNAVVACREADVPLVALDRPAWTEQAGDLWHRFPTVEDAVAALPIQHQKVFTGLGRLSLGALARAPQHHYVVRVIDPITKELPFPQATVICARGPFQTSDDVAMFREHGISCVLSKNSGGNAAYSKIAAARELHIPVFMIERPDIPSRPLVGTVDEVLRVLEKHHASSP